MKLQPLDLAATRLCADTLARTTFPLDRIAVGVVIPVEVADLSRYARALAATVRGTTGGTHHHPVDEEPDLPGFGHIDVHSDEGEHGHGIIVRNAVWGLYWLPTKTHPGGRISIERSLDPVNAQKTLLAEAWHGVDYTALNEADQDELLVAYHGGHHWTAVGHVRDWFEEQGELDYRDWCGESGMGDFIRIASDYDASDFSFFTHKSTPLVLDTMRRVLERRLAPPPVVLYGFPGRKVYHKASCWTLKIRASKAVPLTLEQASARRPCKICRPGPVL